MTLGGHHALVTGAGSGIGAAIARRLSEAGARVSLAGRRAEPLDALARELPESRSIPGFDVTWPESIALGLASARAAFGPVSILVNNAGAAASMPFKSIGRDAWDEALAVNLTGAFETIHAVLPDLGEGGRIINIASTAGLKGYPYVAAYVAAKHGLVGLTRALAIELAPKGVTVNAVCPGYTDTPMLERTRAAVAARTGRPEQAIEAEFLRGNPLGRLVRPEEVAEAVLWLASPGAASVTGQAISISGGEVMTG
jgi:NAD(P)-dependent dehydrogenase (short-subunit alcohol dehydrogenase family)